MGKYKLTFVDGCMPSLDAPLPFQEQLFGLFASARIPGVAIHCPNVIRFIDILLKGDIRLMMKDDEENKNSGQLLFAAKQEKIQECMEMTDGLSSEKIREFLKIAALYHDLGKYIRPQNHPQIGVNLLRNLNPQSRDRLVEGLEWGNELIAPESKNHRFSLLCSILQHHDKFGVVGTGEASLPLFSDILYFSSDENSILGIRKNITAVMLVNLADVAAVCTAPKKDMEAAQKLMEAYLAKGPVAGKKELQKLDQIWTAKSSYLGLRLNVIKTFLSDWETLLKAVDHEGVRGNRTRLKNYLITLEQNPHRTIQRFSRLMNCCSSTTKATELIEYINPTLIESVLVGTLGGHQFHKFCESFALIVKMDYSLGFFKAIVCATIRKELNSSYKIKNENAWQILSDAEVDDLQKLPSERKQAIVTKIAVLYVRVIHGIIMRYSSVLDCCNANPYRFGLQMRDIVQEHEIREAILNFLCTEENREHVALTWIADEVFFWSFD